MKKKFIYYLPVFLIGLFCSCDSDDLDPTSIFDQDPPERNEFDLWILDNYVYPYNIDLKYRMEDIESSMEFDLVPARIDKAQQLAVLVKYLWLETYDELAGLDFTRAYVPKVLHMIGSRAWNNNNTYVLGTAEGGLKVTLYNVNELTIDINALNESYFHTMHHEFAHILHQTKNYDPAYELITEGDYIGANWYQLTDLQAFQSGFVSRYSASAPQEDFVEMYSRFLTYSPDEWDYILAAAGSAGRAIIEQKFEIMKNYFRDSWEIDVYALRDIIRRRSLEMPLLDLENLY